jgi:hypothetical protein
MAAAPPLLFSSSSGTTTTTNNKDIQKRKEKPKRKILVLRIPPEIVNLDDIRSVLCYFCEQEETIIAVWSHKRKVWVLIESLR